MWWGESEWSTTSAWLRLELEEEEDTLLLEQLRELEEWAVTASARAAAAAARTSSQEQAEAAVMSIRAEIEALYKKHNPDKLPQVRVAIPSIIDFVQ